MLKKITNDLMILNKYIIFVESILDEDIDYTIFATKIFYDITFINCSLNILFEEFTKNLNYFENENLVKIYYSSIKRFYKIVIKVLENHNLISSMQKDFSIIKDIKIFLENRIENIKNFNNRKNIVSKEKECINEKEYSLLLESLDDTI